MTTSKAMEMFGYFSFTIVAIVAIFFQKKIVVTVKDTNGSVTENVIYQSAGFVDSDDDSSMINKPLRKIRMRYNGNGRLEEVFSDDDDDDEN